MYELFYNKKLLSILNDTNYKLLKFNENIDNCFLCSIIYPYVSKDLIDLTDYEVNDTIEIFKKKINKVFKNKYKIKTTHITNNYLDKLSDLIGYNIAIFNKSFNNLNFINSNKFSKTLYLITRNKDFFILVKCNKNIKLLLPNNLLNMKGGTIGNNNNLLPLNNVIVQNNLPDILNRDGYYNNQSFDKWLKDSCNEIFDNYSSTDKNKSKIAFNKYKEILTAIYSNYFRIDLYTIISNINSKLKQEGIKGKCIISGGDGFNNLTNNSDNRKITSDIDLKVTLETKDAIKLYNIVNNNQVNNVQPNILKNIIRNVEIDLLKLKNGLYVILEKIVITLNNNNLEYKKQFNFLYHKLYTYLKNFYKKDIPYLKTYKTEADNINKPFDLERNTTPFLLRNNLNRKGIINNNINNPFKLYDFTLYSIDFKFDDRLPWNSIPGILDFVIMNPEHDIIYNYSANDNNINYYNDINIYSNSLSVISIDYYIKDSFKLISLGLRTENKKFIKDIGRILQILVNTNLVVDKKQINNYIQFINLLIEKNKPETNEEIEIYKIFRSNIQLINNKFSGGGKHNSKNKEYNDSLDSINLDFELDNYYDIENEKMTIEINKKTSFCGENTNVQRGGTNNFKHINYSNIPLFLRDYLTICDNNPIYCLKLSNLYKKDNNNLVFNKKNKKIIFKPNFNFNKFTEYITKQQEYYNVEDKFELIKKNYDIIENNTNFNLIFFNKTTSLFNSYYFSKWYSDDIKFLNINNICIRIGELIKYDKKNILIFYYYNRPEIGSIFDFNDVDSKYSDELCKLIASNLLNVCYTLNIESYINTLENDNCLKGKLQKLLISENNGFTFLYKIIDSLSKDLDINVIETPINLDLNKLYNRSSKNKRKKINNNNDNIVPKYKKFTKSSKSSVVPTPIVPTPIVPTPVTSSKSSVVPTPKSGLLRASKKSSKLPDFLNKNKSKNKITKKRGKKS